MLNIEELKTYLKTTSKEDFSVADSMTDATENILRGRAEFAEELINWIENKEDNKHNQWKKKC